MNGITFNRFVIAPSDDETEACKGKIEPQDQPPALQSATLGAFGGFFDRGFRAHDYALGRRNCQKFLCDSFVLPMDNVIIRTGLDRLYPDIRESVIRQFNRPAPGTYAYPAKTLRQRGYDLPAAQITHADGWLPIIPLCSDALKRPLPHVERVKMSGAALNVDLIRARFKKLMSLLISTIPSMPLRIFLRIGQPVIRALARGPLRNALIAQLGDSYQR